MGDLTFSIKPNARFYTDPYPDGREYALMRCWNENVSIVVCGA